MYNLWGWLQTKNKLPYGLRVWPDEEGAQCPSLP